MLKQAFTVLLACVGVARAQLSEFNVFDAVEHSVAQEDAGRVADLAEQLGLEVRDRAWWGGMRNALVDEMHPAPGESNYWQHFLLDVERVAATVQAVGATRVEPGETVAIGEWDHEANDYGGSLVSYWVSDPELLSDRNTQDAESIFNTMSSTLRTESLARYLDERCRPATDDQITVNFLMPYLGRSRAAARGLRAWARWLAGEGRMDEAVEVYASGLALGTVVAGDPWLLNQLVGIAIRQMFLDEIVRLAASERIADEHVLALIDSIRESRLPEPARAFESERILVRCELDNVFRLLLSRIEDPGKAEDLMASYLLLSGQAPHQEQAAEVDRFFRMATELVELPVSEQVEAAPGVAGDAPESRHLLFSIMKPAYGRIAQTYASIRTSESGTLATLALARYHAAHGAWPESLEALVPDFIVEVPKDDMDGERLRYRVRDPDADSMHDALLLYSIGRDLEDEGGVVNPENPNGWRSGRSGDRVFVGSPPITHGE